MDFGLVEASALPDRERVAAVAEAAKPPDARRRCCSASHWSIQAGDISHLKVPIPSSTSENHRASRRVNSLSPVWSRRRAAAS